MRNWVAKKNEPHSLLRLWVLFGKHVLYSGSTSCLSPRSSLCGDRCFGVQPHWKLRPPYHFEGIRHHPFKTVYGHYKRWCSGKGKAASSCSHRFNAARFGKEQWGAFPELGSIYKASVVKSMLFWCNQFLKEQVGKVAGATERANCIHAFAKFQYLLDINGPFLNDHQVGEAVKYARTGLLLYQDLAANDRSRDDGRRFYKLIPKFHSFFEMTIYMESSKRNPRLLGVVHSYFDFWNHKVRWDLFFELYSQYFFWFSGKTWNPCIPKTSTKVWTLLPRRRSHERDRTYCVKDASQYNGCCDTQEVLEPCLSFLFFKGFDSWDSRHAGTAAHVCGRNGLGVRKQFFVEPVGHEATKFVGGERGSSTSVHSSHQNKICQKK